MFFFGNSCIFNISILLHVFQHIHRNELCPSQKNNYCDNLTSIKQTMLSFVFRKLLVGGTSSISYSAKVCNFYCTSAEGFSLGPAWGLTHSAEVVLGDFHFILGITNEVLLETTLTRKPPPWPSRPVRPPVVPTYFRKEFVRKL